MRNVVLAGCLGCVALFAADTFTKYQREFWSFQKVKPQTPPAVKNTAWARNAVDQFILARLEAKSLAPNPPADKVTLLRRATLDLTGLPPTLEEVQAFLADRSPNAYEKTVDRLLASPQYGERWARHWLDLARYAESDGFKADDPRPNAWHYRDYVIQAFNSDKPYDRFVQEQIAGDEMWPQSTEAHIATGFNRHFPDEYNARNLYQRRQEILDDITDVTGATFMGLTYGCARCHNHKFDPILQADYYRLQSFYANTAADDHIPLATAAELAGYRTKRAEWERQTAPIREKIAALLAGPKKTLSDDTFDKYPPEIQAMILKPAAARTPYEEQMASKAYPYLQIEDDAAAKTLKGDAKKQYDDLRKELAAFDGLKPKALAEAIGLHDLGRTSPATHILGVGNYDAPKEEVQPGFLTLVAPGDAKFAPPAGLESTGRRTALAKWLTDPENPLPARVMVNRIWNWHFGKGIVDSPSDFGIMGTRPSHPELLDWLAAEFVRSGWSMKHLHRLIMTSAAYRESAAFREDAAKADESDRLLWSFPRQRLDAEEIRDAALLVSGVLNNKVGGPSVFPELPQGMITPRGGWKTSDVAERNRRSVYVFVKRNSRYPLLEVYDMPDTHESCPRRMVTTTAPQALTMMNDRVTLEWAQSFATRVLATADPLSTAFLLAYSRQPDGWEKDTVQTFLHTQKALIAQRAAKGEKIALPAKTPEGMEPAEGAAWVDFCQMLLNSNEFVYRN